MKISSFLIAMVLVSFVAGFITIIYVQLGDSAGMTFDNTTFTAYDEFERLQEQTSEINKSLKRVQGSEDPNIITFASTFIASGWTLLKSTFTSFDIFTSLTDSALSQSGIGSGVGIMKIMIFAVMFILFALAIAGILVGREL